MDPILIVYAVPVIALTSTNFYQTIWQIKMFVTISEYFHIQRFFKTQYRLGLFIATDSINFRDSSVQFHLMFMFYSSFKFVLFCRKPPYFDFEEIMSSTAEQYSCQILFL